LAADGSICMKFGLPMMTETLGWKFNMVTVSFQKPEIVIVTSPPQIEFYLGKIWYGITNNYKNLLK